MVLGLRKKKKKKKKKPLLNNAKYNYTQKMKSAMHSNISISALSPIFMRIGA